MALNLLPILLRRETGFAPAIGEGHTSLNSIYASLYPNACVKLRTTEATNIQFSPCGTYIVGLNSSSQSISIWEVDSFLSGLSPPAWSAREGSSAELACSNSVADDISTHAQHQRLETQSEIEGFHMSSHRAAAQPVAPAPNGSHRSADAELPQKPTLSFSNNLFANFNPVWQGQKGTLLGKHGRDLGDMHKLAPVEVGDDASIMEEARSVLCTPAQPLNDAQLQQAWDRRSREQQELIASWNQSRKRLRQSRQAAAVATATPPSTSSPSAPPPPSQPAVLNAPCLRPTLHVCGRPADSAAPEEIVVQPGCAALVATVTAGHEKVNDSICLYTSDRMHVLLLAESQPLAAAAASSSIIMVSLRTGTVVDRVQFTKERLVLQRNRSCVCWSLHGSTLVVLCPTAQQVHVYHVSGQSLVHNRTLGTHLRHDDELVLLNLAAQEQQYRSAGNSGNFSAAHGNLLPRAIADMTTNAVVGPSSNPAPHGVAQPGNYRSSETARAASDVPPGCHITGIKQRIEAFVYQRALDGEELGVGHLFPKPTAPDCAPALDELVRILRNNNSLVDTLVAMNKLCLHKDPAGESDTHASRVAAAVGRFHQFRSGLDQTTITAVHALDESHLLMLLQVPSSTNIPMLVLYNWFADNMLFVGTVLSIKVLVSLMWYSQELNHLHDSCMWKADIPHSLVMQQQLNTLVEQAALSEQASGSSWVAAASASAPHLQSHAGATGSSSMMLSRSRMQRSSSERSFSQLKTVQNGHNSATARCTNKRHPKNLQEQVAAVLEDARSVGAERMGQFLLWHLPGASQGTWASPYTNPVLFVPIRKDRIVHFHGSRTLRFSASSTKIEFCSGGSPGKQPVFDLDWSTMIADLDPSDASQPKFCDVKFHPYLPLVITCFPSLSCFCIHYRT